MLVLFTFFDALKEHFFMASISLLSLPLSYRLSLMSIGLMILLIDGILLGIVFYIVQHSFVDVVRNRLLLPDPLLKSSIEPLQIRLLSCCGYDGYWLTWVFVKYQALLFIEDNENAIQITHNDAFMTAQKILSLTATLLDIIFAKASFVFRVRLLQIF